MPLFSSQTLTIRTRRGPEILILGTGGSVKQLPPDIKLYLNSLGIRVDVMDTVSYEFYGYYNYTSSPPGLFLHLSLLFLCFISTLSPPASVGCHRLGTNLHVSIIADTTYTSAGGSSLHIHART